MSKCNCGCGSSSAPKTSEVRHKGKIVQIADDGLLVDLSVQQSECECCALSAACSRNNRNIVKIFGANKLKLEVGDKVEVQVKATPLYAFISRYKTLLRYVLVVVIAALTYLFTRNEEITCVVLVIAMVLNFVFKPKFRMNSNSVWKIIRKI